MLPVDYGYLHNSIYIVNWAFISVFRAGFGRFRPVSLGFVKKTLPLSHTFRHKKCQNLWFDLLDNNVFSGFIRGRFILVKIKSTKVSFSKSIFCEQTSISLWVGLLTE